MEYLLSFLEGIITFVSPCLLPMLPVYLLYFAGGEGQESPWKTLLHAMGFVGGFTAVFLALGAFAGTLGGLLIRYRTAFNLITGAIVIAFGLNYLGLFGGGLFRPGGGRSVRITGVGSAFLFGLVFSISWTPCVGAMLGSALMLASQSGSALKGVAMLLCYSAGLGIPFVLSAVLIDQLKGLFDFIKRHYTAVTRVSGLFLVAMGILMATGHMGRLLALLSV